jgi:hypothetical protein
MSDAQIAEGSAAKPEPSAEPSTGSSAASTTEFFAEPSAEYSAEPSAQYSAEPSAKSSSGRPGRHRRGFGQWRRSRPFWGGLLVVLGGAEIILATRAPLPVMLHVGMQGAIGYLIPVVIVICGFLIIFTPDQRLWNSCVAMVLGLATWLTSNLGGFIIGMLLTLVGAALAFAWSPRRGQAESARSS